MDKQTRKKDMAKLRLRMDGDDTFMGAHQIKKVRVQIGQKDTPAWAMNDAAVRKLLLQSFPLLTDTRPGLRGQGRSAERRRFAAARWNQAINLVYRVGMPYNHAAEEMNISVGALRSMLRNIRRAARGLWANGKRLKGGKRGRPKTKGQNSATRD